MAAFDLFETINSGLSPEEKESLKSFIQQQREDLLAARSEDARTRLVHQFMHEVQEILRKGKR